MIKTCDSNSHWQTWFYSDDDRIKFTRSGEQAALRLRCFQLTMRVSHCPELCLTRIQKSIRLEKCVPGDPNQIWRTSIPFVADMETLHVQEDKSSCS